MYRDNISYTYLIKQREAFSFFVHQSTLGGEYTRRFFYMGTEFKYRLGKQNIDELQLPTLYFITMNQWLDVIDDVALISWLKFFTWTKQKDTLYSSEQYDQVDKLTESFSAIAKKLKVGTETLQNKILKPLWNVGLIDIIENESNEKIGSSKLVIIVYRYPMNQIERSYKPLEVLRNYDKEYNKKNRVYSNHTKKLSSYNIKLRKNEIFEVLEKHKTRLANDKIDVKIITDLWIQEQKKTDSLTESEFAEMLNNALEKATARIGSKGSITGFFVAAIRRYKEKKKESK